MDMSEKQCSKCGETKPFDAFVKAKACQNGRCCICKTCINSYRQAQANREKIYRDVKVCTICHETKSIFEFHKSNRLVDGHREVCKSCRKEQGVESYERRKGKVLASCSRWRKTHREKCSAYRKIWIKSQMRNKTEWYQRELQKNQHRAHRFRLLHPEKVSIYKRQAYERERKNCPWIRMWRGVLRRTLNQFSKAKEGRTVEILGYSALDLKSHLEVYFQPGMNWGNYGKWHIDHTFPVKMFPQNTPLSVVNALSNLRPMWGDENLRKGAKICA